jgi:hypothetical protein
MKSVRPKPIDLSSVKLSPEEGFVLSRVDGQATVKELVALTGFDESRVVDIIGRLRSEGALEEVEAAVPVSGDREPSAIDNELLAFLQNANEPAELEVVEEPESGVQIIAELEVVDLEREAEESGVQIVAELEVVDLEREAEESPEAVAREAHDEREYRKIYEAHYRAMGRDERMAAATEAAGSHLLALCLDAEPQVIHAVLSNTRVTLECPRLIATHHRTHVGLEHIARRSEFLADSVVQRRLLRNPQLPNTILGRMVNPKMMMDVYKIAIDREIPERSRVMTREILRKKFMLSSSDERASLLFKTEGRCLIHLVNCSLDAHATQILCSKTAFTTLFIQNLTRWSATPPALLGHLLKMQVVRHNVGLKKMILKHPNTPSELKRAT